MSIKLDQYKSTNGPPLDPNAIPNIDELTSSVVEFLEYMNTSEMFELEKKDYNAFENHLDNKFGSFTNRYYKIFKMLIEKKNREDNTIKLLDMLGTLKKVKIGELDINKATEDFSEEITDQYIYKPNGGKARFEEMMRKRAAAKKS